MKNKDFTIHQDKPITSFEEDELGREEFAKNLANSILSWKHRDSWVLALTGKWGSGKTSIKNLIIKHIKDRNKKTIIVDFSPWQWSTQELITQALFDELEREVDIYDKYLAYEIREYKNFTYKTPYYGVVWGVNRSKGVFRKTLLILHNISTVLYEPTIKLLPFFGMGIFLSSLMDETYGYWFYVLFSILFMLGLATSLYQFIFRKGNNLKDHKSQLKKSLSKLDFPVLIILDDIDRLNAVQLQSLMQLIKSNLDFNNVIFFLLYSKEIVEKKLSDNSQSGTEYMQKIVQYEVSVPEIDEYDLKKLFLDKLNEVLKDLEFVNDDTALKQHEFYNVYENLLTYFKDMRAIFRFYNSLRFNLIGLINNNHLGVNVVDFMIMETFRLFEPELYEAIKRNKLFLTGNPYFDRKRKLAVEGEVDNEVKDFKKHFVTSESEVLVEHLFPVLLDYGSRIKNDNLRISNLERFDNYFLFSNSKTKMDSYDIQLIKEKSVSESDLRDFILDLVKSPKKDSFLIQIKSIASELNEVGKLNLSLVLSFISNTANDEGMLSERNNLFYSIKDLILNIKKYQLFDTLKRFNKNDISLYTFIRLIDSIKGDKHHNKLTDKEVDELIILALNSLRDYIQMDYDGFLNDRDSRTFYLFFEKYDNQYAKAFLNTKLKDRLNFKRTLKLFINSYQQTTSNTGEWTKEERFDKDFLFKVISKEEFESLLNNALNREPNDKFLNKAKELYYNKDMNF